LRSTDEVALSEVVLDNRSDASLPQADGQATRKACPGIRTRDSVDFEDHLRSSLDLTGLLAPPANQFETIVFAWRIAYSAYSSRMRAETSKERRPNPKRSFSVLRSFSISVSVDGQALHALASHHSRLESGLASTKRDDELGWSEIRA